MLTDNPVLVNNIRNEPTIMCAQRSAKKVEITEDLLVQANINSFGDDIGKITNRITAMFDVMAQFDKDSEEYKVLDYRIKCGQLFQQDAIDKAKGIIAKPMPKSWYDRGANRITDDMSEEEKARREFNLRILADKKPYFMRYIYPDVMSKYNTYITNTEKKCVREFCQTIDELLSKRREDMTAEEIEFITYYHQRMPVGMHDCVMNKICRRFEEEFDSYPLGATSEEEFDYEVMKSGQEYTVSQRNAVQRAYEQYVRRLQEYIQYCKKERVDEDESAARRDLMIEELKAECEKQCSNSSQLCDIILDMCYNQNKSKQFCWDMCGEEIVHNLLVKNGGKLWFPKKDPSGDVVFGGQRFLMASTIQQYRSE